MSRIVALAAVSGYRSGRPDEIWEDTRDLGAISQADFNDYFENADVAHAIQLGIVHKLAIPIPIDELIPGACAPQSFRYLPHTSVAALGETPLCSSALALHTVIC